jgi:hypothetical protein
VTPARITSIKRNNLRLDPRDDPCETPGCASATGPSKLWCSRHPEPGRQRWHIENQGFNRQKNSGLNLEHAFSTARELLKEYCYLLQIAHTILQILEAGRLLLAAAAEFGRTSRKLFGSLKNLARLLL